MNHSNCCNSIVIMKKVLCLLALWSECFTVCLSHSKNNVCRNFKDYINIDYSENCWYNPDVFATPETITRNHGFEFQSHSLVTEDGYRLTIFRVQDKFSSRKKQPILLHHGLISTGICFLLGNDSLAFYLAKNGYDVWLANHRGTVYSTGHVNLKISDPKYWDFSFHEIGLYDLPAVVEYITTTTGNFTKIIYIGHSMGSTVSFVYSSLKKEHAEKYLKAFIALCPSAIFKYINPYFKAVLPSLNQIVQYLLSNEVVVLFPDPQKLHAVIISICRRHPEICLTVLDLFDEYNPELDAEVSMLFLSNHPSRTSLKCVAHFIQLYFVGKFQQYDYGWAENMRRYNSVIPLEYPLEDINIPIHMFYGLNDRLAMHQNVKLIFNKLKSPEKSFNLVPQNSKVKFNHFDFISSKKCEIYLYQPLMRIFRKLQAKNGT